MDFQGVYNLLIINKCYFSALILGGGVYYLRTSNKFTLEETVNYFLQSPNNTYI